MNKVKDLNKKNNKKNYNKKKVAFLVLTAIINVGSGLFFYKKMVDMENKMTSMASKLKETEEKSEVVKELALYSARMLVDLSSKPVTADQIADERGE